MDTFPRVIGRRVTARARRRRLRFGLPRAIQGLAYAALLLLVVGFLLGYTVKAHAFGTVPSSTSSQRCWVYGVIDQTWTGPPGHCFSTIGELRSATAGILNSHGSGGCSNWYNYNGADFYYSPTCGSLNLSGSAYQTDPVTVTGCPSGSAKDSYITPSDNSCKCDAGFKPNAAGTQCEAYNCTDKGGTKDQGTQIIVNGQTQYLTFWPTANPTGQACSSGCTVKSQTYYGTPGGTYYLGGDVRYTGSSCEDRAPADPKAVDTAASGPQRNVDGNARDGNTGAPNTCPTGQCPGTVNGSSVCVACSASYHQDGTGAASAPTSGASAPPLINTPPGTSSFTQDTVCAQGTCTTTTKYFDIGGNPLGATTTTRPDAAGAGTGGSNGAGAGGGGGADPPTSSFGGSCGSTSCTGDAVVCAIAQEQAKRDCQFQAIFGDGSDASIKQPYDAAVAAGATPADHPHTAANITSTSLSTFDQTNLISGSCGDWSLSLAGGKSLTLPLSKVCGSADLLGQILVGLTALTCLGIVFVRGS